LTTPAGPSPTWLPRSTPRYSSRPPQGSAPSMRPR
jgi:hypothetical protein